jgi:hypothetical protein
MHEVNLKSMLVWSTRKRLDGKMLATAWKIKSRQDVKHFRDINPDRVVSGETGTHTDLDLSNYVMPQERACMWIPLDIENSIKCLPAEGSPWWLLIGQEIELEIRNRNNLKDNR